MRVWLPVALLASLVAIACGGALAKAKPKPKPNPGPLVKATIRTGLQPCGEIEAAGAVWISAYLSGTLERINPATNKVTGKVTVGSQPCGLAYGFDSIWINAYGTSEDIFRIDPATDAVTRVPVGEPAPAWFSSRGDELWVATNRNNVLRIDPATNGVTARVRVGLGPKDGLVDSRGLVWTPNMNANSVSIVDAATATLVATLRVGETPFVLNDGFGDIWSGSYGAGDVRRLRAPRIVSSTLSEHDGSGQSGSVRLIAVSRTKTFVAVTLSNPPAAAQPVHLHGGRCGSFAGLSFGEWMLRDGRGAKIVPAAISKLANGRYALDVHRAAGDSSYVACANIR
jgi:YVTN family beta-propeller protein